MGLFLLATHETVPNSEDWFRFYSNKAKSVIQLFVPILIGFVVRDCSGSIQMLGVVRQ